MAKRKPPSSPKQQYNKRKAETDAPLPCKFDTANVGKWVICYQAFSDVGITSTPFNAKILGDIHGRWAIKFNKQVLKPLKAACSTKIYATEAATKAEAKKAAKVRSNVGDGGKPDKVPPKKKAGGPRAVNHPKHPTDVEAPDTNPQPPNVSERGDGHIGPRDGQDQGSPGSVRRPALAGLAGRFSCRT